jgi:hypothetical protein
MKNGWAMRTLRQLLRNIGRGIVGGLALACLYTLYVALLYMLRGATPFQELGTTFRAVVMAYMGAGISIGVIVGIFLPLARKWWGAMLVGFVAGMALYLAIDLAEGGRIIASGQFPTAAVIFAMTIGSLGGLVLWHVFVRTDTAH